MQRFFGRRYFLDLGLLIPILIALILPATSCHDDKNKKTAEVEAHFDINTFNHKADSLLTEIQHKNIHFVVEKSVNDSDQNMVSFHFSPGKGNLIARFNIYQDYYSDPNKCNEAFMKLVKAGTEFDSDMDISGLTYTNDFVFKTRDHIYWINTPCYYADFNHDKLKQYFMQSINNLVIEDSLVCWCGGMCRYAQQ